MATAHKTQIQSSIGNPGGGGGGGPKGSGGSEYPKNEDSNSPIINMYLFALIDGEIMKGKNESLKIQH